MPHPQLLYFPWIFVNSHLQDCRSCRWEMRRGGLDLFEYLELDCWWTNPPPVNIPKEIQWFLCANWCRISVTASRGQPNLEPNERVLSQIMSLRMIASNEVGVVVEGTADVLTAELAFLGIFPWHERSPSRSPKRRRVHKFQLACSSADKQYC